MQLVGHMDLDENIPIALDRLDQSQGMNGPLEPLVFHSASSSSSDVIYLYGRVMQMRYVLSLTSFGKGSLRSRSGISYDDVLEGISRLH